MPLGVISGHPQNSLKVAASGFPGLGFFQVIQVFRLAGRPELVPVRQLFFVFSQSRAQVGGNRRSILGFQIIPLLFRQMIPPSKRIN
jgi:hypothetical protein